MDVFHQEMQRDKLIAWIENCLLNYSLVTEF